MIKYTKTNMIKVQDWDDLVVKTYGRPYKFQQQMGCQDRGTYHLQVPSASNDNLMHDSIPEEINGDVMGVKFAVWLTRDPKQPVAGDIEDQWNTDLFWERNFYPDIETVANDLHKKGLIEAGEYVININW
jgi:hypothetical protein